MDDLKIQFSHSVNGTIQLRKQPTDKKVKMVNFSSDKNFTVDINVNGLTDGEWTASLEWNHNNQPYLIKRRFRITDKKMYSMISN